MELNLNEKEQELVDSLSEKFTESLIDVYQSCGHTYFVVEASDNLKICKFLKEEHHFLMLCDIAGTDRYTSHERFELIYNMMNLRTRDRIFVKIRIEEENPVVQSVTSVWSSASWHE